MPTSQADFFVAALDCPEEFALVEKSLSRMTGIEGIQPNYLDRAVRVRFDAAVVTAEQLAAAIRDAGFSAEIVSGARPAAAPPRLRRHVVAAGTLLTAALGLTLWGGASSAVAARVLAIGATIVAGLPVARAAGRALRQRVLDMNVLMTLAAGGALSTGDELEAAATMFLFGVALWLESYSVARARRAAHSLVEMAPTIAHRMTADLGWEDVDPRDLTVGARILVRPGERIPIDGRIVRGESAVNEAPITGESVPAEKRPGDTVFAGSLNGEAALEVEATSLAAESTLAHIRRLVDAAGASRSPTERFVDRFARRYTPAVILLAVILACGPPLAGQLGWIEAATGWRDWLHRGLVLLVIACPCALVISTPVTIVCGLYQAARQGLLIKGGAPLEQAGRILAVAFDKTGTLTLGQPAIVKIERLAGSSPDEILAIAAALEQHSEHPLAKAICRAAVDLGLVVKPANDVVVARGFGVTGTVGTERICVASPRFVAEQWLRADWRPAMDSPTATPVVVASETQVLGVIGLADEPRADAAAAVAALRRTGVRAVAMLTGDGLLVAQRIANHVGVDEFTAELLPEAKVRRVEELVKRYGAVAMIGDGVNDAPALAAASLGVAFGGAASDTAMETAEVIILRPRVSCVVELLRLGRRCRRLLSQNIALALAIKLATLALAAVGLAPMWSAVAADVGASLLVIANGMRIIQPAEIQGDP